MSLSPSLHDGTETIGEEGSANSAADLARLAGNCGPSLLACSFLPSFLLSFTVARVRLAGAAPDSAPRPCRLSSSQSRPAAAPPETLSLKSALSACRE